MTNLYQSDCDYYFIIPKDEVTQAEEDFLMFSSNPQPEKEWIGFINITSNIVMEANLESAGVVDGTFLKDTTKRQRQINADIILQSHDPAEISYKLSQISKLTSYRAKKGISLKWVDGSNTTRYIDNIKVTDVSAPASTVGGRVDLQIQMQVADYKIVGDYFETEFLTSGYEYHAINTGEEIAYPEFWINGSVDAVTIQNLSTGQRIDFNNDIADESHLYINSDPLSLNVSYNQITNAFRYIDFNTSTFFPIYPDIDNRILVTATNPGVNFGWKVRFSPSWT